MWKGGGGEAFATHERAGEITYKCLGGYTYQISITTYTKGTSKDADRCSLEVNLGDDTSHYVVCRSNYESGDPTSDPWGASCNTTSCATHHMGEWTIGNPTLESLDIKKNIYTIIHTYPGPNTYIISMTDPNRNDNIVNVGTGVVFSIQDTLNISPFITCNNSPMLMNPPVDKACVGQCFIHNPGAVDQDGDSLAYHLGTCFNDVGHPIPGYKIPTGVSLNPVTGDFIWCSPQNLGSSSSFPYEYNFAIDIQEWRKVGGEYILIGTVRRDMQVTVYNCNNRPPIISNVQDTCVVANTALTFTVTAQDQGSNDIQSFIATGGPFNTTPAATFTANVPSPKNLATGLFSWTPNCLQVRKNPYLVILKATDDGAPDIFNPVLLSDYKTFFITVIAPAPKNLTAVPKCTDMLLRWDTALCNNHTGNMLFKYEIYRKDSCDTLKHSYCETGVPANWGYTRIASVPYNVTSYTDNNGGNGLTHGVNYSYRVVALYYDGSESYCSAPVCNHLVRDVPILTNVDVVSTGVLNGQINVKWVKPLADPSDYDTLPPSNHGPYRFELMRVQGFSPPNPPAIQTFTSTYFSTLNTTSYLDAGLNTLNNPYTYRVDFYDTSNTNCPAQNASSVFVSCHTGESRKIQLTWQANVPWTNYRYDVFKKNSVTSNWDSLTTTALQTFTDTGLVNGRSYCYKVRSTGSYSDTTLPHPLINWSEERCCAPQDLVPPCANTLAVDSSCELSRNILTWTNPNKLCSDDALYYILYYTTIQDGDYSVLDTIPDILTLSFLHDSLTSIAGCYAVTSVDSFGNQSAYSNIVCVDNCPFYQLPNVFTPNDDGKNDKYTPLHPYKYVKDIDIKIYDRWGVLVFHTSNPEILWDGKSEQSKMPCNDGVYYYVCIVNDIRLKGIVPHVLKGNIHLLNHE